MSMLWSPDTYQKAIDFAARAHGEQQVPGKPYSYVVHISSVCMESMAAIAHGDVAHPDLAIQVALLHDVLEDTATTYLQVAVQFGQGVADGVAALTKNPDLPKDAQMQDSLQRILLQPSEIGMVKLADRITNLQKPPAHWQIAKIIRYRNEAEQIYQSLHGCNGFLAHRLKEKIDSYSQYVSQA